jgi:ADP-ribose pyrophosphatase YjhB (NUDIX family)
MNQKRIKIICGALIVEENSFVAVQENKAEHKGKWSIPGGHLENNESLIEGLKREIKEETGLDIHVDGFIEIYQNVTDKVNVIKFAFKASKISGSLVADQKEIMNIKWMSFDDFLSLPSSLVGEEEFKTMIKDFQNKGIINLDIIQSI